MIRKSLLTGVMMLAALPAFAQAPKAEVGVVIGYVFADGVSGNTLTVPGVGSFNRIDPKDSFGWGFDIGVFVGPNVEVGFQYKQQPTKLEVGGSTTVDIGDLSLHGYHGTVTYNFGPGDGKIRPYLMGGLGGTSYGDVNFTRANGATGTISGLSRFSTTWGTGVKFYGEGHVGGRFGLSWTPTYIKSDATGWWCDPYWGCYVVGSAQYSNQFEINGGVTVRF